MRSRSSHPLVRSGQRDAGDPRCGAEEAEEDFQKSAHAARVEPGAFPARQIAGEEAAKIDGAEQAEREAGAAGVKPRDDGRRAPRARPRGDRAGVGFGGIVSRATAGHARLGRGRRGWR